MFPGTTGTRNMHVTGLTNDEFIWSLQYTDFFILIDGIPIRANVNTE